MEPQAQAIVPVLTNPYASQSGMPIFEMQFLLTCAVVCLLVGLLLAEQNVLRRILSGTDETLAALVRRRISETI